MRFQRAKAVGRNRLERTDPGTDTRQDTVSLHYLDLFGPQLVYQSLHLLRETEHLDALDRSEDLRREVDTLLDGLEPFLLAGSD